VIVVRRFLKQTMQIRKKNYLIVILITFLVFGLDQITKYLVCKLLPLHSQVEAIHGFLTIIHIRNAGVAFGLLKGFGSQYKVFSLMLISAITIFLLVFIITQIKKNDWIQMVSLSLVLGGAVGNLIDRFRFGEVIDFIDVHWKSVYHWPTFNFADSAITVGIIIIVIYELFRPKRQPQTKSQS